VRIGITKWGLKVQTIYEPQSLEEVKATTKEQEGIEKETICMVHHETENQLIDVICPGHKDGNTGESIGKPKPKCTTHTYIVTEFYNNSF
jgi:tRNA1(Val) A37 N6-methylase TrmN6